MRFAMRAVPDLRALVVIDAVQRQQVDKITEAELEHYAALGYIERRDDRWVATERGNAYGNVD